MRIYYKKKFWAGVGALLLGLALPGTCLFVGWERFDLKDAVLTMFMVLSGISGILRSLDREKARQEQERAIRGGDYAASGHVVPGQRGTAPTPPTPCPWPSPGSCGRTTFPGSPSMDCATPSPPSPLPKASLCSTSAKPSGHSTPATTGRIYTHLVDRTHEDLMLRVSDALK